MGGRFGELLLILIIALLLFGPNKLPSLAKALGEALREFKKAANPDSQEAPKPATPAVTSLPSETQTAEKKNG
ncbi:MAG TPA: twin-arginine translocase TatA/TatE family subunit [bacterium]|nr:twin-arginine translocase TatA/TatE family subunit [bacterium]